MLTSLLLALALGAVPDDGAEIRRVLEQRCVKCHGLDGKVKGKVNLLELKTSAEMASKPALLEDMIAALKDREMPPEKEPPLGDDARAKLVAGLEAVLKGALKKHDFEPVPLRRMTRFQYNNAVVDLLGLDRNIFRLNERLIRRYEDYFKPATRKMPDQVKVASWPLSKDIDGRRAEGFRGVAPFPQDKRAEHGFDTRADHLTLSPLLMESFLSLSRTIVESPDLNPRECRSWNRLFAPPGTPEGAGRFEAENGAWLRVKGRPEGRVWTQGMKRFGPQWSGDAHLIWMCRKNGLELTLEFTTTRPAKEVRIGFTKAPDYGSFRLYLDDRDLGGRIDLYDPRVMREQDMTFPVSLEPGVHTLRIRCVGKKKVSKSHLFAMDVFEVVDPAEKKARPGSGEEVAAIRSRLEGLMRRAFRRPVDPGTLDRFTAFAKASLASGASFEETMRTAVGAVLATPDFLYLYEDDGKGPVTDFELASRLAVFLWGSIPDDALLDLAEQGRLKDPEVLSGQVDRMMDDPRSVRFCESFAAQWLQLDRLITAVPDKKQFPYFYYSAYRGSMHMMLEPMLLFETVFVEDRPVTDLLAPDFTYQSELLASLYEGHNRGKRSVNVLTFKRAPVDDPRRGGVITNAAILTMTSLPDRTQPITRGAWINTVIFNDPPEPPPADVPPLPEPDAGALAKMTIRERFLEHRKREDCAGCHNQIDPLGFALENYGPTGVWRDRYANGREVDAGGVLFNRLEFASAVEFKRRIVEEKRRFVRGFAAHLLAFGLGRETGPADSPALDEIAEKAAAGEDSLRTILKRVAMSEPFLHKNTRGKMTGEKKHGE